METLDRKTPPGLSANELEFHWDFENQSLMAIVGGQQMQFSELPQSVLSRLTYYMEDDKPAMDIFEKLGPKQTMDRLFIYVKCKFGGFSWEPDFKDGTTKPECWNCKCNGQCILKPIIKQVLEVRHGWLSEREIDVIRTICSKPYPITEAAASQLNITISTLNKHKKSVFSKTGIQSIQELAVWATKMDLL
jgi:DNA-binding CsgD family transcriptional regulator